MRQEVRSAQVCSHHFVVTFRSRLQEIRPYPGSNPGIVHEKIKATKRFDRLVYERTAFLYIGDVRLKNDGPNASRRHLVGRFPRGLFVSRVIDDDIVSGIC